MGLTLSAREFETRTERLRPLLLRAARLNTYSEEDALDAVQQALVNAYEHLYQYDDMVGGPARFASWLGRILQNACADLRRFRARRREVPIGALSEAYIRAMERRWAEVWEMEERERDSEEIADAELEDEMKLRIRFADLTPSELQVVVLRREGMSLKQVASEMNWPSGTAKTHMHRAKVKLMRVPLEGLRAPDLDRVYWLAPQRVTSKAK